MKFKIKPLITLAFLTPIMLAFQNCGKPFQAATAVTLPSEGPVLPKNPTYDQNGCPIAYPAGQNFDVDQNDIYSPIRTQINFGKEGDIPYSCRSDIPTPYILDPPDGSRPGQDRALYNQFMGDYFDYIYRLSTITNEYIVRKSNPLVVASCALDWIYEYAATGLLTEEAGSYQTRQGDYERLWAIGGISLAYAKIKDQTGLNIQKKQAVENWLKLASTKILDFSYLRMSVDTNPQNNILYWSGMAILTGGLIFNNQTKINRGIEIFDIALNQITSDGYLPLELARGTSSFWYHQFALRPLVIMAEISKPYGYNLYTRNSNKIELLSNRVIQGYVDFSTWPDYQIQSSSSTPNYFLTDNTRQLDWAEIIYSRFASPALKNILATARSFLSSNTLKSTRQTGGGATQTFGVKCL